MISIAVTRTPADLPTPDDLEGVVGAARRERAERVRLPQRQWQMILADRLVGQLLARRGGGRHGYTAVGRPYASNCFVSVSHDSSLVVAVAASSPIGVDVVDTARPELATGSLRALSADPAPSAGVSTIRHTAGRWAVIEAVTKRWGTGLALAPRRLTTRPAVLGSWTVRADHGRTAQAWVSALGPDHVLAISCAEAIAPPVPDIRGLPLVPHVLFFDTPSRPERQAS